MLKQYFSYSLLTILLLMTSCKSSKDLSVKNNQDKGYEREPIVEISQSRLETDALFIDALKDIELGNANTALNTLKQVIAKDSNYSAAYYELGNLYFMKGDANTAVKSSLKAIELNPSNNWYLIQLAGIYQQLGQHEKACQLYEQLVKKNPAQNEYYEEWARAYLMAEKGEDAIRVYNMLEKRIGVTEEISMRKQQIWLIMGQSAKANLEIEKLATAFPQETKYSAILAESYMKQNDYPKALRYYTKIKEASPNDRYIDVSLAEYYKKTGNHKLAYESLKRGFQNPALDEDAKVQILASFYTPTEFYETYPDYSSSLTQTLLSQYPENAYLLPIYGDIMFRKKNYKEALDAFKKTVAKDSSRYQVWEAMLFCEIELKADSLVFIDAQRVISLFPTQPLPYYIYGIHLSMAKNYDEAISVLNKGTKWVFTNDNLLSEFYAGMGECYYRKKEYSKSDEYMEKAVKLTPENYPLLNNYAYYLSERKANLTHAEKMSAKTLEKFPEEPTYLDTYAWILFVQGKYSDALVYIEKALKFDKAPSGVVLEHYGDILFKNQQAEKALHYWKKAMEEGSTGERLQQKIDTGTYHE